MTRPVLVAAVVVDAAIAAAVVGKVTGAGDQVKVFGIDLLHKIPSLSIQLNSVKLAQASCF